jgi:hypothetical protein
MARIKKYNKREWLIIQAPLTRVTFTAKHNQGPDLLLHLAIIHKNLRNLMHL